MIEGLPHWIGFNALTNFGPFTNLSTLTQGKVANKANKPLVNALYELADYVLHGDTTQKLWLSIVCRWIYTGMIY